jgi:hypothetical protein
MRFIIAAVAAMVAAGLATPTPSVAAAKKKMSLTDSYNACVSLARARGYSSSDLDGNRTSARNFVINCMKGSGQRAQKQ